MARSHKRSARTSVSSKKRRAAEAPMTQFHPDDPRSYCHCQLVRRPVAFCESGRCRQVPPPGTRNKGRWQVPALFAENANAGGTPYVEPFKGIN